MTPQSVRASDIMSSPVLGVRLDDPVLEAGRKMAKHGVSGLAVLDETMKTLARSRVKALGIDAQNTIVVDRERVLAEADRRGIAVVAL